MKKIFGSRLKKLRMKNGEYQADLAEVLKVDTSMISLWENGKNYPEVVKLIEIAEYYNVTTDYLLGLSNEEPINNSTYNNYGTHNGNVNF